MDRYVLDRGEGKVYVVAPRFLGDFPYAEYRLKDSGISRVERVKIEKVEVRARGKTKVLVQRHANTPQKAFWADPAAPDKAKLLFANWMDKLSRMSVIEYLPADKEPAGMTTELTVEYLGDGKALDEIRFYRPAASAAPADDKQKPTPKHAYARTTHSRALVKINGTLLDEILRDVDAILK